MAIYSPMAPVAVLERAELATLDEFLQPVLQVAIIAGRGHSPARDRLRQFRCRLWIGGKRGDYIHPVERMQVVEMVDMVMHLQRELHDVADDIGVFRDGDAKAFSTARTDVSAMGAGADAADPLGEGPSIARIAALRITSSPRHMVPVETALRMTLFASTFTSTRICPSMRVTGSTTMRWPELSSVKPFGVWIVMVVSPHFASVLVVAGRVVGFVIARFRAERPACAAMEAPTTPAAAVPIASALASMPN